MNPEFHLSVPVCMEGRPVSTAKLPVRSGANAEFVIKFTR